MELGILSETYDPSDNPGAINKHDDHGGMSSNFSSSSTVLSHLTVENVPGTGTITES